MRYSGSAKTFQFDLDMVRHLLHNQLQYNLPICICLNIAILKSIDPFYLQTNISSLVEIDLSS